MAGVTAHHPLQLAVSTKRVMSWRLTFSNTESQGHREIKDLLPKQDIPFG